MDVEHVELIDQSHNRCQALGVSRIERPDLSLLGRPDLNLARERNKRLNEHAAPVMEMLHEQIVNTHSMVVLTDATGTVLHSIGDDDFLERASKVALKPGANWAEQTKGTNAIGTALIEEMPTLVHADEHYLHANHFLTCSAAPILDPRGNILGVLDVTGDQRSYHQHTMALVKMSARMIENHWLTDDYRNVMRLHFHSRVEFIGTLMEGILAVGPDGKIVGANRGALEQLGMSGAALRMHTLTTLLGTTVGALVDRFRSPVATPSALSLSNGRQFHAVARFNWPVWASLGETGTGIAHSEPPASAGAPASVPVPGPAAPAAAGGSALNQLRTGDAQLDNVVDKIRRVLDRDIPILILGDTGTGKELLARAIHTDSARGKQPFVAVNCASIPDTLIEAELFGYEDGAFTGARRKGATGKIVQANGGTLFLDEIGDMPVALQAHLLRVLQERQVTPLGSSKSVAVDVTIICATHRNLREMIEHKQFREDLFYRLNGLAVKLPPLRERSDLRALARRILDREAPGRRLQMAPEVLTLFEHYHWPGNVRQLFNVLRTAVVMAATDPIITRSHLSDDFLEDAAARVPATPAPTPWPPARHPRRPRPPHCPRPRPRPPHRSAPKRARRWATWRSKRSGGRSTLPKATFPKRRSGWASAATPSTASCAGTRTRTDAAGRSPSTRRLSQQPVFGLPPGALPVEQVSRVAGHVGGPARQVGHRGRQVAGGHTAIRRLQHGLPVGGLQPRCSGRPGRALFADPARHGHGEAGQAVGRCGQRLQVGIAAIGGAVEPQQTVGTGHPAGTVPPDRDHPALGPRQRPPVERPEPAVGAVEEQGRQLRRLIAQVGGRRANALAQALHAMRALLTHRHGHLPVCPHARPHDAGIAQHQLGPRPRVDDVGDGAAEVLAHPTGQGAAEGRRRPAADQPQPATISREQQVGDEAAVVLGRFAVRCRHPPQAVAERNELQNRRSRAWPAEGRRNHVRPTRTGTGLAVMARPLVAAGRACRCTRRHYQPGQEAHQPACTPARNRGISLCQH
jgi:transcriptional regulator of acetoin/glycerol metabolism